MRPPTQGLAAASAPAATPSPAASAPAASAAGLEGASADEILAATQKAFASASSVHLKGTFGQAGQAVTLDMRLRRGVGATGSVAVGGKPLELTRVGKAAYIRGSKAFYAGLMPASAVQQLAGKWLKVTSSSKDFASLLELTDFASFAKGAFKPAGAVGKGTVVTVGGRRVVELKDSDGSTLDVSLEGPAYPVRISGPTSEGAGLTFTEYGAPVVVKAPPASQVVAVPGSVTRMTRVRVLAAAAALATLLTACSGASSGGSGGIAPGPSSSAGASPAASGSVSASGVRRRRPSTSPRRPPTRSWRRPAPRSWRRRRCTPRASCSRTGPRTPSTCGS